MADDSASVYQAVERALTGALGTVERQLEELQSSFGEVRRQLGSASQNRSADRFVGLLPSLMQMQAASAALAAGIETVLRFVGASSQWAAVGGVAEAVAEFEPEAVEEREIPVPGRRAAPAAIPVDVDSLPEELRTMHLKARRFAKVTVQELAMYKSEEVTRGRQHKDLYRRFKEEIDKSKALYDKRFEKISSHNVDYLYDELVRVLAENDPSALGDYPYSTPASAN